jgi:hypothetical protein
VRRCPGLHRCEPACEPEPFACEPPLAGEPPLPSAPVSLGRGPLAERCAAPSAEALRASSPRAAPPFTAMMRGFGVPETVPGLPVKNVAAWPAGASAASGAGARVRTALAEAAMLAGPATEMAAAMTARPAVATATANVRGLGTRNGFLLGDLVVWGDGKTRIPGRAHSVCSFPPRSLPTAGDTGLRAEARRCDAGHGEALLGGNHHARRVLRRMSLPKKGNTSCPKPGNSSGELRHSNMSSIRI